jgi:nucleoside-diphosphate-sugar epimerase
MNRQKRRILIAGVTGFLGRALAALWPSNDSVYGVSKSGAGLVGSRADLSRFEEARHVVSEIRPDVIVHLVGRRSGSEEDLYTDNVMPFKNVLESVRNLRSVSTRPPLIILACSSAIYAQTDNNPIGEDAPAQPSNCYGMMKLLNFRLAEHYAQHHGLPIRVLRFFNLCGPGQSQQYVVSHFCNQVARMMVDREEPFILHTRGLHHVRDFLNVRDAARAIVGLVAHETEPGPKPDVFNVCTQRPIRIGYLASTLKRLS